MSNGEGSDDPDDVGSVGQEAAKLFGALSEWARDHGTDLGQGLAGVTEHASAAARDLGEHIDTGAAECAYCPICRTVHLVRQASPEVREQLTAAAASLMQAAAGLMAAAARSGEASRPGGVERIDLDEGDVPDEAPDGAPDGSRPGDEQ